MPSSGHLVLWRDGGAVVIRGRNREVPRERPEVSLVLLPGGPQGRVNVDGLVVLKEKLPKVRRASKARAGASTQPTRSTRSVEK